MKWEKVQVKEQQPLSGHSLLKTSKINEKSLNSQILSFGGTNENSKFNSKISSTIFSQEKLTMDSHSFIKTNKKPEPRERFTLTEYSKGSHFLFGGLSANEILGDSWILKTENKTEWISIKPATKEKPTPRYDHTSSYLFDNQLILFGGHDEFSFLNDVWWIKVNSNKGDESVESTLEIENDSHNNKVPCPRMQHASTVIKSNSKFKLYIFGGKSKYRLLNDLWCLDIESMLWKNIKYEGNIPSPRQGHILVSYESFLLLYGGYSPDFKNPNSSFPSEIFTCDTQGIQGWDVVHFEDGPPGRFLSCTLIYEDNLLVHGGMTYENGSLKKLSDVWKLKTYFSKVKESKIANKYQILQLLSQKMETISYKVEFKNEIFYLRISKGVFSNSKSDYVQEKLKHKNILEIIEVIVDSSDNSEVIVFPYCDLGDLLTFYRNFKTFTEFEIVEYCIQFLDSVNFIHSQNIAHGSIQPKNIIVKTDVLGPVLKLTGFNEIDESSSFKSPNGNEKLSKESDIWAVGLTLNYFLSKKYHLSEIQDFEKNDNRFRSIDDNLSSLNYKNSNLYLNLIKKCLCENPKDRVDSSYLLDEFRNVYRKLRSKGAVLNPDPLKIRGSTKKEPNVKRGRRRSGSFMKVNSPSPMGFVDNELPQHLSSVKSWLRSADFDLFESNFKKLGYDDLSIFPQLTEEEILMIGIPNEKVTDFKFSLRHLKKEVTWYLEKEVNFDNIENWLECLNLEKFKEDY
eukprot:gene2204-2378_t